jgi:hypothetical protein
MMPLSKIFKNKKYKLYVVYLFSFNSAMVFLSDISYNLSPFSEICGIQFMMMRINRNKGPGNIS